MAKHTFLDIELYIIKVASHTRNRHHKNEDQVPTSSESDSAP
jgi:hypothetical protein